MHVGQQASTLSNIIVRRRRIATMRRLLYAYVAFLKNNVQKIDIVSSEQKADRHQDVVYESAAHETSDTSKMDPSLLFESCCRNKLRRRRFYFKRNLVMNLADQFYVKGWIALSRILDQHCEFCDGRCRNRSTI